MHGNTKIKKKNKLSILIYNMYILSLQSLLLYHTCPYILGAPDDGWMWRPKHVEQDEKWNKHWNCCVKLVFYSLIYDARNYETEIQRDFITNVHRISCKVRVIFVILQSNLRFLDQLFPKNTHIANVKNIHPVGADLFREDERTRHDEGKSCFCEIRRTRLKFYVLHKQCIFVFCVDLRTNSDYFPIQH